MLELDIHKRLDGFGLDLQLNAPEEKIVVLFGPSGAGKTMALSTIAGLLAPDRGRVAIGDRILYDSTRGIVLPPQARRLGLVRQDLALFPHLTVEQNVAYGLTSLPRPEPERRTDELLEWTNLAALRHRFPSEISGGQQQRVALARALAIRPSLLLLDEPFSALDAPTRIALRAELKSLQERLKTSVLFVTHDLGEAFLLADCLAVIDRGRLLQFDLPETVAARPANLRVAQIIGIGNILPALVLAPGRIRIGERELLVSTEGFEIAESTYALIRPERVTLVRKDRSMDDLPNVAEGNFVSEESDGADVVLCWRARGPRFRPDQTYDLRIDTPVYVYERLDLSAERAWAISIKPGVVRMIKAGDEGTR